MKKSKYEINKECRYTTFHDFSKNPSPSNQKYCNKIINRSDKLPTILSNKGGVRVALQKDKTEIYNYSIYFDVNKKPCPLFGINTLKKLIKVYLFVISSRLNLFGIYSQSLETFLKGGATLYASKGNFP